MFKVEKIYTACIVGDFPTITAQQKGITKTGKVYTKPEVRAARNWFAYRFPRPDYTLTESGACYSVVIKFGYKTANKKLWGKYKPTRPDVDNQAKLILDVLKDICVYSDDSAIVNLELSKKYAEADYIDLDVYRINED